MSVNNVHYVSPRENKINHDQPALLLNRGLKELCGRLHA